MVVLWWNIITVVYAKSGLSKRKEKIFLFRLFFKLWGYFSHFLGFGIFWPFFRFRGYFSHFLGLGAFLSSYKF